MCKTYSLYYVTSIRLQTSVISPIGLFFPPRMFFHMHSCFISKSLATVAGCLRNKSIRVASSNDNAFESFTKKLLNVIPASHINTKSSKILHGYSTPNLKSSLFPSRKTIIDNCILNNFYSSIFIFIRWCHS